MTEPEDSPLIRLYDARLARGALRADPAQRAVLDRLESLRAGLATRPSILPWRRPEAQRGLYIWGDVGRGKSMLMDLFVQSLPPEGVRRIHFHAFLRDLHAEVHRARQEGVEAPVERAVARLTGGLRVFAFDEMQVSGIADAMILSRLFTAMLEAGITILCTSNLPPEKLYEDGLQRAAFLPFVDLVSNNFEVIALDGEADHRQGNAARAEVYFTAPARPAMDAAWARLGGSTAPLDLVVHGRTWRLASNGAGAVRASFAELCEAPRSSADYLALAEAAETVLIDDIPRFTARDRDPLRRFVLLVDALYEARVTLIASAAALPADLAGDGVERGAIARTASRLEEMRGDTWPPTP